MIHLHDYWRSSASYRVRIALNLTGEAWTSSSVNLLEAEHKSDAHLERNPQGLVPVLEIDDLELTQSLAMIEYIDETRKLDLIPTGAAARARVRALSHAIAMDIHPVCNLSTAKYAVAQSGGAVTMESWMQNFIGPGLTAFEALLGEGTYCFGDSVSMADLCLVPQMYNARRWGVDVSQMPKCVAIDARLNEIDAFQAAHPDRVKP